MALLAQFVIFGTFGAYSNFVLIFQQKISAYFTNLAFLSFVALLAHLLKFCIFCFRSTLARTYKNQGNCNTSWGINENPRRSRTTIFDSLPNKTFGFPFLFLKINSVLIWCNCSESRIMSQKVTRVWFVFESEFWGNLFFIEKYFIF